MAPASPPLRLAVAPGPRTLPRQQHPLDRLSQSRHPLVCTVIKRLAAIQFATCPARALSLCVLTHALLANGADAGPGNPGMVVIGFPATSEETISLTSLRAIFGMIQRQWPADTPIKLFVLRDDTADHTKFSKSVLQVFPHQLRSAWERGVLSGQSTYPGQLESAQEMLRCVPSTPGAIGYLRASHVNEAVRVIAVQATPAFVIPAEDALATARVSRQAAPAQTARATDGRDSDGRSATPVPLSTPRRLPSPGGRSQAGSRPLQESSPAPNGSERMALSRLLDLVQHLLGATSSPLSADPLIRRSTDSRMASATVFFRKLRRSDVRDKSNIVTQFTGNCKTCATLLARLAAAIYHEHRQSPS